MNALMIKIFPNPITLWVKGRLMNGWKEAGKLGSWETYIHIWRERDIFFLHLHLNEAQEYSCASFE
jgi:hypothetical protein